MRNKKSGATLIFVIVIFMFLTIVSTGILSMILGNYKARVAESKRVENLYSSESGLDTAYNICGKTVSSAIKYGYFQVSELKRGKEYNNGPNSGTYELLQQDIEELNKEIKEQEKNIEELKNSDKDHSKAEAIEECYKKIEKCKAGISTDETTINILLKEEFKCAFKAYIQNINNDETGQKEENYDNANVLEESIKKNQYIDLKLTYDKESKDDKGNINKIKADFSTYNVDFPNKNKGLDDNGIEKTWPYITVPKLKFNKCPKDDTVKITNKGEASSKETHITEVEFDKVKNEYYDLTLNSEFLLSDSSDKVIGKNIREVQCFYRIDVPEYDDVLWESGTGDIKEYTVVNGDIRGLTVGGNMNVNDIKTLNVNGNIFVQGKAEGEEDIREDDKKNHYGKYKGGIQINNAKEVKFNVNSNEAGSSATTNVATRGTFNIQDKSNVVISGDIYAANVFAGKSLNKTSELTANKFTDDSGLKVNNMIIDNDLTLRATNTNIDIQNFYGINDRTSEKDESNKERTSSSIIINGYKDANGNGKSHVKINQEAYIMGVAHIATESGYETGESIAVKGNYIAYAVPVDPSEVFKYDKPLQVLDTDDVGAKAEHFNKFWNKIEEDKGIKIDKKIADDGGIILPNPNNIHSIGAIVYKKSDSGSEDTIVSPSKSDMDLLTNNNSEIRKRKSDYAKYVFNLGINSYDDKHDYYENYEEGIEHADRVEDILSRLTEDNLSEESLGFKYDLSEEENKNTEVALFNYNPKREIVIDKDTTGVIVTKGSVRITNGANFTGDIIAEGNLIVEGHDKESTITYSKEVIDKVIADENNSKLFKAVFAQFEDNDEREDEDETLINMKQLLDGKYDIKKYLQKRLWKIIR